MASNGESWILKRMAPLGIRCVFDVGANVGEWSRLCRTYNAGVSIHAFEIAPPVFKRLQENLGNVPGMTLNAFGISEERKEITIYYPEDANYATSAFSDYIGDQFADPNAPVLKVCELKGRVTRGDEYAAEHGIKMIDFLKIDVEGMEGPVLRGFEKLFKHHQIRIVQFEYNTTNIVSGFLLHDAYQLLNRWGYLVGKLYPDYVEFRDYHYRQEDFCGPNMIAVRREDAEVIKLLSPPS